MASWTCGLCTEEEWGERHPTKGPVMDHIREQHLETLIRASLERSEKDPNRDLDGEPLEVVEA